MKKQIMKSLKASLLLVLMTTSLHSFASGKIGNGGDAVVCEDGSVTLLDSYEAIKLGLTINLKSEKPDSLREFVFTAVKRLSTRDKYTAKLLWKYSMEMISDLESFEVFDSSTERFRGAVLYLGPDTVGEISDSEHRTLPENCELRQLVSQKKPERLRDNRYEMNLTLWKKLSLLDQAMTILHEAWYRIMIEDGAKDSVGTRYMNALIASLEFEEYSFADYIKELKTTEKKNYIIENNSSFIFDKKFKVNLKKTLTFEKESVCTNSLKVAANIKKLGVIGTLHFGTAKTNFTNVCFNNSVMIKLTMPRKLAKKRINFVFDHHLIRTHGLTGKKAIIHFNENGTFKTLENLKYSMLYEMYHKDGKGPFLNYETKVKSPKEVIFGLDEKPIGYFN